VSVVSIQQPDSVVFILPLEREALVFEERSTIESLLAKIQALPPDTKLQKLRKVLADLQADGYDRVIVFTQ
jgi:hypothetical protein